MKNKILLISLAAVLALSLSIVGCTGGVVPELELVFSDHNPPTAAPAPALIAYGQYIEDHSGGKVTVDVHINSELYTDVELYPAVKSGACDAGSYVPEIGDGMYYAQILTLPFMGYPDQEGEQEIFWELCANHTEILQDFTTRNVTYAVTVVMPPVHFHYYAENLTVDEPADLNGMSLLVLEGDIADQIEYITGLTAIQTDFPGLFTNLANHIGNGYVQHLPFLVAVVGFDYLHSHTLFPGGIRMVPIGILWNTASYNACVNIVGQEVMDAAAALYCNTFYVNDAAQTEDFWDAAVTRGDTFTSLNSSQLQAFTNLLLPYHSDWIGNATNPAVAQAIYDDALALIAAS